MAIFESSEKILDATYSDYFGIAWRTCGGKPTIGIGDIYLYIILIMMRLKVDAMLTAST